MSCQLCLYLVANYRIKLIKMKDELVDTYRNAG